MTKHTMKASLFAVAVALLLGSPAWSLPPETDDEMRKELRDLKDDVARLKREVDLDRREAAMQARRLEDRLERMTRALEKLSGTGTGTATSRTSLSVTPARRGTGTIRLDNRLGVQAQVTIDGLQYSIPPRSVRILRDQATGVFSYDVTADGFGQANYRSSLANNETLTVTVY